MTETIHEHITSVRATLDELEAALHAVDTARARYHEVAGGLAERLGAPRLPELLQLPTPTTETIAPPRETKAAITETPPPGRLARRAQRETPAVAGGGCYRANHGPADGRSPCRGDVVEVRCDHPGCKWTRDLCAAHREGGREDMARSGHMRVAHTREGKAAMTALQKRSAAARDGRPKHRKARAVRKAAASGRADKERHPAAPATTLAMAAPPSRRELIAQRARVIVPPATTPATPRGGLRRGYRTRRCSNCGEPGHRAPGCPQPPGGNVDDTGAQRSATAALDVAGLAELDTGHSAAPRAVSYGAEE